MRVFSADGTLLNEFFAFNPNFQGGVTVAVGNFDAATGMEIAVAAGPGAGPHVKTFHADGSSQNNGFYAYDANFGGGVRIAPTQIDGGLDEIVTVPRSYGGPHVRAFSPTGVAFGIGTFAFNASVGNGLTVGAGASQIVVGVRTGPALTRALPLSVVY